jgi:calcium permeable stress-gated cation channel
LIVTISSGIIAALPGLLNNPGQIPSLLAQNLPLASTFFLTYLAFSLNPFGFILTFLTCSYILLQALSGTAGGFLQLLTLILHYVMLFVLGSTPRSVYRFKYGARTVTWGALFPSTTLLVVIGMAIFIILLNLIGLIDMHI